MILHRVFNRTNTKTADIAKSRLQSVLTEDRTNISPEILDMIKSEVIKIIESYVELDKDNISFSIVKDKYTSSGSNAVSEIKASFPILGAK